MLKYDGKIEGLQQNTRIIVPLEILQCSYLIGLIPFLTNHIYFKLNFNMTLKFHDFALKIKRGR